MEIKTVIVINLSLHIHAHTISCSTKRWFPNQKSQYWFSDGTIKKNYFSFTCREYSRRILALAQTGTSLGMINELGQGHRETKRTTISRLNLSEAQAIEMETAVWAVAGRLKRRDSVIFGATPMNPKYLIIALYST